MSHVQRYRRNNNRDGVVVGTGIGSIARWLLPRVEKRVRDEVAALYNDPVNTYKRWRGENQAQWKPSYQVQKGWNYTKPSSVGYPGHRGRKNALSYFKKKKVFRKKAKVWRRRR
jgi:hypothetical protein